MPVLVGLGVDELSVAAARVGLVRAAVRELDYSECRRKAAGLLDQA
jgi:phosphocarrier protein FPr